MGKWTRRGFIGAGVLTGGALVVGVAIRPGNPVDDLAPLVADGEGEQLVNAWIKVGPDNIVTAIVPHSEMGQGIQTTLGQMLADEMDADWANVRVQEAPAADEYANYPLARGYVAADLNPPEFLNETANGAFQQISKAMHLQITGGSSSVRFTGQRGMRVAGAAAREMLMKAAATLWDVDVSELRTEKSMVHHDASKRSETFANLAAPAAKESVPTRPTLKTPDQYKLMGTPVPRLDIPAKVNGTAQFGIDATLPGMKYAAVKSPPVFGSTVESIDAAKAKSMNGVLQILNMGDFVAVIADGYWQAQQALNAVGITYSTNPNDSMDQEKMFASYAAILDAGEAETDREKGDAAGAFANAAKKIEAEYKVPFLAHATMEPMNCTAWVHDGKLEVWAGSQNPLDARYAAAEAIGFDVEDVTYTNAYLGGGFGRRSAHDFVEQAARLAKAVSYPVKVIWSREEDMAQDNYRPAVTSRFQGGLDENGKTVSWENIYVIKDEPEPASSVDQYDIPNQLIRRADAELYAPYGPWRSVAHTQHGFFVESFVDELAEEAGKDPYEYRRTLLVNSPRHLKVLEGAAKMAGWGTPLPEGHGRGIAIVESFQSIVAEVAEVDITGVEPKVTKVFCCADAGYVMNPDGFIAQMESGIIYGLTSVLFGEISLKDGAVQQSNFHDYKMVRMDNAPEISVEIINSNVPDIGGGGEPGTPPIAPAVTNAIFAATGSRIRNLPIKV